MYDVTLLLQVEEETVLFTEVEIDSTWEPDERATSDPANFRINTWHSTCLSTTATCVNMFYFFGL